MKKLNRSFQISYFSLLYGALSLISWVGCAEKKTRLWIEPPVGSDSDKTHSQKLFYQVEDVHGGKKESLMIPIQQTPDNLTLEENKGENKTHPGDSEVSLATRADQQIRDGKLSITHKTGAPTVSYLRGLSEVEALYQKKMYTESLIKLAPLIEQYPQQTRLFVMQGTLFKKMGEKKLALEAYQKAQKLDSQNPEIMEAVLKIQDEIGEKL